MMISRSEQPYRGTLFDITTAARWLEKLTWEFEEIRTNGMPFVDGQYFRVLNFTLTAWHMTDWVYREIGPKLKQSQGLKGPKSFQEHLILTNTNFAMARSVADSMKHGGIDKGVDEALEAIRDEFSATFQIGNSGRACMLYMSQLLQFWVEFFDSHPELKARGG